MDSLADGILGPAVVQSGARWQIFPAPQHRTMRSTEWRPGYAPRQFGSRWRAAIGELTVGRSTDTPARVKKIPPTEDSLVLRTDFSDESAWKSLCAAIQEPVGDFRAYVDFVSDTEFDGLAGNELLSALLQDSNRSFAFIVDSVAISDPSHPILVMDLFDTHGRTFRVVPSEMQSVQNNLSIANMDFEEFAAAVDADGVFRGFPET
jgi:hypothetical protein